MAALLSKPPRTYKDVLLKADTGATGHYIRTKDSAILTNLQKGTGPQVRLPDSSVLTPTTTGQLPIPKLPPRATTSHVYPGLQSASLLSIGQLCDEDCSAVFTKDAVKVLDRDHDVVVQGVRNQADGLWDIPLPASSLQSPSRNLPADPATKTSHANVVLRYSKSPSDLAAFLHAAAGCPTKSTFLRAIKNGNFTTWPGLTTDLISKHLLPSVPTLKGHMKQEQKNIQSTKLSSSLPHVVKIEPEDPVTQSDPVHECFLTVTTHRPPGTTYSDQAGRYPIKSSRGNQYIVVCYDYDTNSISALATKTRQGAVLKKAVMSLLDELTASGHPPSLHIMDNEASHSLKQTLLQHNIQYQLVPPHLHRRNAAERAIQTFKSHFITTLCIANPNFPATEWDRLLPQAVLTLNLLRNSRTNPRLSSHAAVHGPFDYNRTPLAPPGIKTLIHEKPDNRRSWSPRATEAWYVGPALEHYRCVTCYVPSTHGTRIADTVEYVPHAVPVPTHTTEDLLRDTASDLIATLQHQDTVNPPLLPLTDSTRQAIRQVATILNRAVPTPPPVTPPTPAPEPASPPSPRVTPSPPRVEPASSPRVEPASSPRVDTVPSPRVPASQASPAPPAPSRSYSPNKSSLFYNVPTPKSTSSKRSSPPKVLPRPVRPRLDPFRNDPRRQHSRSRALAQLLIQDALKHSDHHLSHIFHPVTGLRETYDSLRAQDPERWERSFSNEIGRLAQGIGDRMPSGNENIFFIPKANVPKGRKVTYANPVCDYRPLKDDPYRVRLTVGGDRLPYDSDAGAPAANLLEAKVLFNSTISTVGARFASADIKDYFLCSPMLVYEYIKIPFRWIPEEVRIQYNLYDLVEPDGYVYCEVRKGMYGLKQAARLAFDNLVKLLAPHGYSPDREFPGLWKHHTRPIVFTLCVDDFGIKYTSLDDLEHLLSTIRKYFKCSVDMEGKNYLGLTLNWNYAERYVDISMPGYVPAARIKFQHPMPKKPQYAPHPWRAPVYGQKIQYTNDPDTSAPLDKADTTKVQSINGTCIYYGRAVDPTILPAVNEISTQQSKPTQYTMKLCLHLLDYLATYPNATIRYYASDMIAVCETDAAYLVLPKARSRIAGHYYFTNALPDYSKGELFANGPFHTECKGLRRVVSSAAEAETGGSFENGQHLVPIRRMCERVFEHPQPKKGNPLITDNSTSQGILTHLVKPRRSKTWDMRHWWLEDRIADNEIQMIWRPGRTNKGDYFTKHHSPSHHRTVRPQYLVNCVSNAILARLSPSATLSARVC